MADSGENVNNEPELPLNDWQQRLKQRIDNGKEIDSDTDYYIFCRINRIGQPFLWLGTRTHNLGGTDYLYLERVTLEQAEWLVKTEFEAQIFKRYPTRVYQFNDAIKRFKAAKPIQGEFIGA